MTRVYDRRERALAARVARDHHGWLVLWGVSSRRYWAFPTGAAIPPGTIVSAPDPRGLVAAIRQVELAAFPGLQSRMARSPRPVQPSKEGPGHA